MCVSHVCLCITRFEVNLLLRSTGAVLLVWFWTFSILVVCHLDLLSMWVTVQIYIVSDTCLCGWLSCLIQTVMFDLKYKIVCVCVCVCVCVFACTHARTCAQGCVSVYVHTCSSICAMHSLVHAHTCVWVPMYTLHRLCLKTDLW